MKLIPLALAAAITFSASMTLAQTFRAEVMMAGLSMIDANAATAFNECGIEADPMTLSTGRLARIIGVLYDPDRDSVPGTFTPRSRDQCAVSDQAMPCMA